MEQISFQYPTWFVLFCLLLGLAYAGALYFRDKTFREQSTWLNGLLGFFRFLTVTLLSILLLSPLLKSIKLDTKKPIIVFAQDQSESIAADWSGEERSAYKESFQNLSRSLSKDFEVKEYSFGSSVREEIDFQFQDKASNISGFLSDLYDLYSNQNLGAIVLATDGIYNQGSNPLYTSNQLPVPVYTVALGDTTARKDLILKRVFHNRIAYLGDRFSIQIDIAAQNCAGTSTNLTISKVEGSSSRILQQIAILIDKEDYFDTREIILDADKSGVQRFRIALSPVSGEVSTANNVKEIFVDVLDARQKILVLANSPHPDLTAIRQSISTNKNYQVSVATINDLKENVADFDFVILHQLPSRTNPANSVFNTLQSKNIPRLFITGNLTDFNRFNQLQSLVRIQSDGRNINEVQGKVAANFTLFTVSEELVKQLPTFSPMIAPFGEYGVANDAQVLLYQRIGRIDTRYPLWVLGEQREVKIGVLCGEGLWKWRLFDFLQHENHDLFDELLGKTVQYLSLKEDKRKFRVNLPKNIFNENEPVVFDAELYNNSYELINEPDVTIVIVDAEGKEFNYTFNKTTQAYTLNAGILPVGSYTFRASVFSNGENLAYNGQFSVQPIQLELYETTADHGLLRLLSEKYGGAMVYPTRLNALDELIRSKETVKPVIYQTSTTRSVINLKWICFLLLLLLSVEWFLRRYFGAY